MPNVVHPNANVTLSYDYNGSNVARLRCPQLTTSYGQLATESHARQHRAFYPHRRSQGTFAAKFDCNGWREYQAMADWFRAYARAALDSNTSVPPPMTVSLPSRDFQRLGVPTKGIEFGDHLGAIVYSPTISFVSVSDPADASTAILKASQASAADLRKADPTAASYFYPGSAVNYPGKLTDLLYNADALELKAAQSIQDQIDQQAADQVERRQQRFIDR